MSLIPSSNQANLNESEDVMLLERIKRYRHVSRKLAPDMFEAILRAWRHYYHFWANQFQNIPDDISCASDDENTSPVNEKNGQLLNRQMSISQVFTPSLKLATQLVFNMSEEVAWDKYIYPCVRKLRSKRTADAQEQLYILLNTIRGFYNEILVYAQLVRELVVDVCPKVWAAELESSYNKYVIKVFSHLGDVERYTETETNLHVASQFYKRALEISKGASGFALNQLATVETSIYEKFGKIESGFRAFGFYVLASLAREAYKGAETNMQRLESKIPKKPRACIEMFDKSTPDLAIYISYRFPEETLEWIAKVFEEFQLPAPKKKKMEGFRQSGSLALGFMKKNANVNNSNNNSGSASPLAGISPDKGERGESSSPFSSEENSQENVTEEALNRLLNAIVGLLVVQQRLLNKSELSEKSSTYVEAVACRMEAFEKSGFDFEKVLDADAISVKHIVEALHIKEADSYDSGWKWLKAVVGRIKVVKPSRSTSGSFSATNGRQVSPGGKEKGKISAKPKGQALGQVSPSRNPIVIPANQVFPMKPANKEPTLPEPPEFIILDTSVLLTNLSFIKDVLCRNKHLCGRPLIVPSLSIDGLDVIKQMSTASRAATNWILAVKRESYIRLVTNENEYLKYNSRSNHDQLYRDKTRLKQLSKFAKSFYKTNTMSRRAATKGLKGNSKATIPVGDEELKQSVVLVSDQVDADARKSLENVYNMDRFLASFTLR